jgi:putative inorganic carbon (HCO3(-)) transporter
MRDYAIVAIILAAVPFCFFRPYVGILFWTWISYFNPHRYGWSFAYNFPVAQVIAVPTLLGAILTGRQDRQRHMFTREVVLLLILWVWFGITLIHAMNVPLFIGHIDDATDQMLTVSKILLMTLMTVLLVNSRERLHNLLLVIAFSFGVRAIFATVFGYQTGGQFKVYGPPGTFIADNNDFALALNMALGLMFFLTRSESRPLLRRLLWICFFSSIVCVLLSYSRGGLLGLAVAIGLIAVRSKRKLLASTFLFVGVILVMGFATATWKGRMGDFAQGNLDESAQQRLVSWRFAINLAKDYPVTGGGFETFPDVRVFQRYTKEQLPGGFLSTGPHSIYFQLLGEQGYVGLGLFLLLVTSMGLTLRRVRRSARAAAAQWVVPYAYLIETGLVAYLVSGAFLGRAYFDLFYQLVALTVILKILVRQEAFRQVQSAQLSPSVFAAHREEEVIS